MRTATIKVTDQNTNAQDVTITVHGPDKGKGNIKDKVQEIRARYEGSNNKLAVIYS